MKCNEGLDTLGSNPELCLGICSWRRSEHAKEKNNKILHNSVAVTFALHEEEKKE